jgi:hypothetical protein
MGGKAARLARQGKSYAHQDALEAAQNAAEDAHLLRAVTRTTATAAWGYGSFRGF